MTFEDWWHRNSPNFECADDEARAIWEAATQAEREACIAATVAERVDFEATGSDEDEVYNTALWHAVEAMQRRSNCINGKNRTQCNQALNAHTTQPE